MDMRVWEILGFGLTNRLYLWIYESRGRNHSSQISGFSLKVSDKTRRHSPAIGAPGGRERSSSWLVFREGCPREDECCCEHFLVVFIAFNGCFFNRKFGCSTGWPLLKWCHWDHADGTSSVGRLIISWSKTDQGTQWRSMVRLVSYLMNHVTISAVAATYAIFRTAFRSRRNVAQRVFVSVGKYQPTSSTMM